MKLLDWILGREPVATATGIAAVITALLGVAAAFGLPVTETQIAAIGALAAAVAGWAARGVVSPTTPPALRRLERAASDPEAGGIPLAFLIAVALLVILVVGMATCSDALFKDEDERDDIGLARITLISHEECDPDWDECGRGDQNYSGGEYEGGQGGDTDQRGDHNCRNFCFYGVPLPDQGGQQPESLFPPTPEGLRDFVLATIKGGLDMGRAFADTTIAFVENLLIGLA